MSATPAHTRSMLARYRDRRGCQRELVLRAGAHGSVLVVDRDACTLCDSRLVAHLAADEPAHNAQLVCQLYLRDSRKRRCRALADEDLRAAPLQAGPACRTPLDRQIVRRDRAYAIVVFPEPRRARPQLRWAWRATGGHAPLWTPLSLRAVVEALEDYEPMRSLTRCAVQRRSPDLTGTLQLAGAPGLAGVPALPGTLDPAACSVALLARELGRLDHSPVVLNRGLREAVLAAVADGRLTMSQIAIRCGMAKRDRNGRVSGETSWLARRVGLMASGGCRRRPTRWIHSDVLAVIARTGLGVSPREVELG